MLVAMTILTSVAVPAVSDYVEDAKLVRATNDVAVLSVSLFRVFNDVGFERTRPRGWDTYDLLVGAGAAPTVGGPGTEPWVTPQGAADVGLLDDQLLRNAAGYRPFRRRDLLGWRGAYLQQPVGPDPWAHRYAVNVRAMRGVQTDTFVLSAGPDGIVVSPFEADGLSGAGDDIVSLVSSGVGQ